MKFQLCKIHGTRLNRLYYNFAIIENGKKHGSRRWLDYYWCKSCMKIYHVKNINDEIIPLEIKN